jgi:ATP-dependent DNA helicase RecG
MAQLDYMEKRGSGLKRILNETKALKDYKEELKPVFKSTASQFMTIIYSTQYMKGPVNGPVNGLANDRVNDRVNERVNDSLNDSLNDSVNATYLIIKSNPGIQRKAISDFTGKSIPTIDRHIAILVKKGLIEHKDSDKTGGYYPVKK